MKQYSMNKKKQMFTVYNNSNFGEDSKFILEIYKITLINVTNWHCDFT